METAALVMGSSVILARVQMALTLGFHICFAVLGIGLPVLILFAEWRGLRGPDPVWRALARRWARAFAVLFAVGAVSGTVLAFELGLLWPAFMERFGAVIGLPFTLEAFAFFLEAIFLGIYLYGWDRLSPRAHWISGFPIALAGAASGWFVVTANAWMNSPQGFRLEGERVVAADPWVAMLNPATPAQTVHMLLAAYVTTGCLVAAWYAWRLLRGRDDLYHRRGLAAGLALAGVCIPLQIASGDWAARVVERTQPAKLAAAEGLFRTQAGAPLLIGGIPDPESGQVRWGLEIPGGLSLLLHGDREAVVQGLDAFPPEDTPPVVVVHLAFQVMVAAGMALLALALWAAGAAWRRRALPSGRLFRWCVVVAGPLSLVALEAGWVVTEVGRQPWIVQGVMRTRDAATSAPGVGWVLAATLVIYLALTAGAVVVLRELARRPLSDDGVIDGA